MFGLHVIRLELDMVMIVHYCKSTLEQWSNSISAHHDPGPSLITPASTPILDPSVALEDLMRLSVYRLCPGNVALRIQVLDCGTFWYYIMIWLEAEFDSLL